MNTELLTDFKIILALILTTKDRNTFLQYKPCHDIINGGIKLALSKCSYYEALQTLDYINYGYNPISINSTNSIHNSYCLCGNKIITNEHELHQIHKYCKHCYDNNINDIIAINTNILDTFNLSLGFALHTFVRPINLIKLDLLILETLNEIHKDNN